MRVRTHNLGCASVGGFKAQEVRTKCRNKNFGSIIATKRYDSNFSKGAFLKTDDPYHMMIRNKGFFAVRRGNEIVYTADGRFSLDSERKLVTADGMPVMDESGETEIIIPQDTASIHVAENGEIYNERNQVIGKVGVFNFQNPHRLRQVGASSFETDGEVPYLVEDPKVLSGGYENSNVNIVYELTRIQDLANQYKRLTSQLKIFENLNEQGKDKLIKVYS